MNKYILFVLVMSFAIAGCMQTEPPGDRTVGLEYGEVVNESVDGYIFSTDVYAVAHRTDNNTYNNVTIVFHERNGDVLNSTKLSSLTTGERKPIKIYLSKKPHFVTIQSPDFWKDEDIHVYGLVHKENGIYIEYGITEKDRLPPKISSDS